MDRANPPRQRQDLEPSTRATQRRQVGQATCVGQTGTSTEYARARRSTPLACCECHQERTKSSCVSLILVIPRASRRRIAARMLLLAMAASGRLKRAWTGEERRGAHCGLPLRSLGLVDRPYVEDAMLPINDGDDFLLSRTQVEPKLRTLCGFVSLHELMQ